MSNIIDFSIFKTPRNEALQKQPQLTSHSESGVQEIYDLTENFEKHVDNMMNAWYTSSYNVAKAHLVRAFIELEAKIKTLTNKETR